MDLSVDDDLLKGFLDESLDLLSEVDSFIASIEHAEDPIETVNAIFRPVHSIKGNAPFFGFTSARNLAHELESLLSLVRDGTHAITPSLVSVLLDGVDELRAMLSRVQEGGPEVTDADALQVLIDRVIDEQNAGTDPVQVWSDVFQRVSHLQEAFAGKPEGEDLESILESLRVLSTGVEGIGDGVTEESLPPILKKAKELIEQSSTDELFTVLQEVHGQATSEETKEALHKVLDGFEAYVMSIGFDDLMREMVEEALALFQAEGHEGGQEEAPSSETEQADPQPEAQQASPSPSPEEKKSAPKADSGKTMRVAEEHIDTFLSYVGELLILGEMLVYLERRLAGIPGTNEVTSEFARLTESFSHLSSDLQKSLMSIRKVKVKTALQKVPRLVRDIAKNHGKDIRVETVGDEIEVDKSLIEMLDAPLTHMVRNAADHGVEKPEIREERGKERTGTISVSVSESEKFILVEVKDDGGGLNYDAIQSKAESLGLVRAGEKLTERQVVDFLFAAGVSTAKEVTDVSGRGVGMDVVKRNIEQAGGKIEVESTAGKGSRFSVEIPKTVTTHIVEALVFEVGDQFFAIPLEQVNEAFSCTEDEIFSATGEDRYLYRQDVALPIVPACDLLRSSGARSLEDQEEMIVLSINANRRTYALLVDSVLGVQQVVVKKLTGVVSKGDYYSGAALIGDGKIALVLEVDPFCVGYDLVRLAERARVEGTETHIEELSESFHGERVRETLLLAHIDGGNRVGIPLSLVNRLEKVHPGLVEIASGTPAMQYRDSILPIVFAVNGSQSEDNDRELDVVICKSGDQPVGLVVEKIVDIVDEEFFLDDIGRNPAIRGTSVIQDKVTDILQVDNFLAERLVQP